ncbi:MAG: acyl-CoA dehydrogenase [Hahellaceae bacterium]|nr:acyl-CoA dehydrogenase [Hahellaceae bacterium]MCP5212987.1 acyl-CoA dehydrogenase [Hahellaceae bacterium]
MKTLIDRQTLQFLVHDLLEVESLCERPAFVDHSPEIFQSVIDTAETIATKYFADHNAKADQNEPVFDGKKVTMIPEVKIAYEHYADAGFLGATFSAELGGMALPKLVNSAAQSYFLSANPSTVAYPFLTSAAAGVIEKFGSQEQKDRFLRPMLAGRYTGTMALTEPDVGSSLGDLRTSATPAKDGTYLIKGHKMYISGGDHELSENIVHLVLARIKGAPKGVKGISLFIVPKKPISEEAEVSLTDNDVVLAGLLHKMGYRGTTSTVLNFGENDRCVGYLLGEANHGLSYMFQMMNEARIGVGLGAAVMGYRGFLESLDYAKQRTQGRLPSNRNPDSPPVAIIQHADVKKMLLQQKCYSEGALALCLYASKLVDDLETHEDDKQRESASELLDLLTPIVKAWPSHYGPRANDLAIQVLAGAGYTKDYPLEQLYRDNRLNPIHEGTNGIQALDLTGRKLWQKGSQGLKELAMRVQATIDEAKACKPLAANANAVAGVLKDLQQTTFQLASVLQQKGPELALANASEYLDSFGGLVVGWLWLAQAVKAQALLDERKNGTMGQYSEAFLQGKIQACNFYMNTELPRLAAQLTHFNTFDDTALAMQEAWF